MLRIRIGGVELGFGLGGEDVTVEGNEEVVLEDMRDESESERAVSMESALTTSMLVGGSLGQA